MFAFTQQGVTGGVLQMVNHGLATGALFLLVGMVYERTHTRDLGEMGGLASGMPWLMGAFLFTAFASAGLPGLNGFVGEFLVIVGTFAVSNWFGALAATAVVLAAIYLLWSYQRMAFGPVREEHRLLPDVNLREVVVLAPVLALLLLFGVAPKLLTDRIDPAAEAVIARVAPDQRITDVGAAAVRDARSRAPEAAAVIAQEVLSTPKLAFEPVLPELVLVAFAIFGLLYEALAQAVGARPAPVDRARRESSWPRRPPSRSGAGTGPRPCSAARSRSTASPSSRGSSCSSSPRSACSSAISTSRDPGTSGRASSHRSCCSPRRG